MNAWHRHCSLLLVANEDDTESHRSGFSGHQVYSQWTRFEDFPHFMQGIKKVILLDDQRLHWETEFTGTTKEWFATITDLPPDQRIACESEDGEYVAGIVTFAPIRRSRTRLNLKVFYDSKGPGERRKGSFICRRSHREGPGEI